MKKFLSIFTIVGILYVFLEVFYTSVTTFEMRLVGHSSLWMMPVGGILGVILDMMNEVKWMNAVNYRLKVLLGGFFITLLEFTSGCVLNLWWGFDIWDYSNSFCNFLGQIDLLHSCYWVGITPFGFWLGDVIRHYMFDEPKPATLGNYYKRVITG